MTDQEQPVQDATQVVETAEPVTPVAPVTGPPGASRSRWVAALGAVALVAALTAAIVYALVGRSPDATVLGYVPSGSIVYGEVRLDLPGDQRHEIGEFLSHFPGFADQAALDSKLDEVLDRLISDASDGKQTFTTNIKPWFDGELAFSAGPLPDAQTFRSGAEGSGMGSARALALLSIKDETLARAWFADAIKQSGATIATETYNGAELTVFTGGADEPKAAFAILGGKVAIAGTLDAVKAAVDTKGDGSFAAAPDAKAALAAPTNDHVGFVYVALRPLIDWSQQVAADDVDVFAMPTEALTKFVPDWAAFWVRVEGDALVMESASPKPATALGPTVDRASDVAKHVPSTAIALAVTHDTGATLAQTLELYKDEADLKEVTDGIDQALGLLGGADGAIGWIGDTGLVVIPAGDSVEGGLVILPTDSAAADRFFTSVRNLAALGSPIPVTFREEDHDGATITTASLDAAGMGGVSPVPVGKVEISWTVSDDVVVIGSGPEFVKHVLDTTEATSLASNARYKGLIDRVGAGTGSTFLDIAAIRGLVETKLHGADAAELKRYETDVKPFLTPFDALVASGSVSGDLTTSTLIVTVK